MTTSDIPERVLRESAAQARRLRLLLETMERRKIGYREALRLVEEGEVK